MMHFFTHLFSHSVFNHSLSLICLFFTQYVFCPVFLPSPSAVCGSWLPLPQPDSARGFVLLSLSACMQGGSSLCSGFLSGIAASWQNKAP